MNLSTPLKESAAYRALNALRETKGQIARLSRRVELLEARCASMTARYGSIRTGSASDQSDVWELLSEERARLMRQLREILALELKLSSWIELLSREAWRMVLRYRYLDCMNMSEVAAQLEKDTGRSCSISQIYRLHRQALDAADSLWPLDQ